MTRTTVYLLPISPTEVPPSIELEDVVGEVDRTDGFLKFRKVPSNVTSITRSSTSIGGDVVLALPNGAIRYFTTAVVEAAN